MPASLPPNPAAVSGRPLLLGADGDVRLVDGAGVDAATLVARLAEAGRGHGVVGAALDAPALVADAVAAGAALLHLDPLSGATDEVLAAAAAGVAVVVTGDLAAAEQAALDLVGAGATGPVVVELAVTVERGLVDAELVWRATAAGWHVGAVLRPAYGPAAEVAGWEIGALTQVLRAGARTVRGVSAARFHRVLAVLEAVDGARAPGRPDPALAEPTAGRLR